MPWPPLLIELRNELAELIPTVTLAQTILDEAGVYKGQIEFSTAALTNWHSILREAARQRKIARIIEVVQSKHPNKLVVRRAVQEDWSQLPPLDDERTDGYWIDVPSRLTHFVGREAEVERLVRWLAIENQRSVAFHGQGGVGKSSLAVAVVYDDRVRALFPDGVFWASLGPNPDIPSIQKVWADGLSLDLSSESDPIQRSRLIANLVSKQRILVVLDDIWNAEGISLLTVPSPNAAHLVTTRSQQIATDFAPSASFVLRPFRTEDASYTLLHALAPRACQADEKTARALAAASGGLPITISTIGAYLAPPQRSRFPQLAKSALDTMFNVEERLSLASKRVGHDGALNLNAALALSLDEFTKSQREAFYNLGAFASSPARFDLEAAQAVTQAELETLALFLDRGLVEEDEAYTVAPFSLHQSFADIAHQFINDEAKQRHLDFYMGIAVRSGNEWSRIDTVLAQIEHAWANLPNNSIMLHSMLQSMKPYFYFNALYATGRAWSERLLESSNSAFRETSRADTHRYLGRLAQIEGDHAAARVNLERAIELHSQFGDQHGLAHDLSELGGVARSEGSVDEAVELIQHAKELHTKLNDYLGMANDALELGRIALHQRDYDAAENYLQDALRGHAVVDAQLGIAYDLHELGTLARLRMDFVGADDYLQRALAIHTEVRSRVGAANDYMELGRLYLGRGDMNTARRYFGQAEALYSELGDKLGLGNHWAELSALERLEGNFVASHDAQTLADGYTRTTQGYLIHRRTYDGGLGIVSPLEVHRPKQQSDEVIVPTQVRGGWGGNTLFELRELAARLVPGVDESVAIVQEAGFNPALIPFDHNPSANWHNIILEIHRRGMLISLVDALSRRFPNFQGEFEIIRNKL